MIYQTIKALILLLILIIAKTSFASTEKVIFEGYYRVLAGERHVGYVIHRYSFDEKNKRFRSTYYLRTNQLGGDITESLDAHSDDKFKPISYQFTQVIGSAIKIIDAKFTGLTMQATVSNGHSSNKISKTFPKGSFLSTFLGYLMLQKGMGTDKHYEYLGIAEEDAQTYKGNAYIRQNMVEKNGMKLFKVLNIFKNTKFSSLINESGEVFSTHSPVQKISSELVSLPAQATKNIPVSRQHLMKLFGNIPAGNIHSFSILQNFNKKKFEDQAPTQNNHGKKEFPPGQGVMIKGKKDSDSEQ